EVEVMADGADQAVGVRRDAGERAAEQRVGLAGAVGVGGEHGVDALAGAQQRRETVVVDRLAEVHEAPAAPGSDGDVSGVRHAPECMTAQAARAAKQTSPPERLASYSAWSARRMSSSASAPSSGKSAMPKQMPSPRPSASEATV